MTSEEAIRLLRRSDCDGCKYMIACTRAEDSHCHKASEMGAKALEKQIPMKAIPNLWDEWMECPMCGGVVETGDYRCDFCPDCGQCIDWSEDDDK